MLSTGASIGKHTMSELEVNHFALSMYLHARIIYSVPSDLISYHVETIGAIAGLIEICRIHF